MSSPSHAAIRASARAHRMVLRVSQLASRRSSVRSRSKRCNCAGCREIGDSLSALTTGPASRVGDDLASFVAQSLPQCLRSPRELQLTAPRASGHGPELNERNHR
jgi:hypothetical protein